MKFTSKGNQGIEILYEESDTETEIRIVEQGIALIRNLLERFIQIEMKDS